MKAVYCTYINVILMVYSKISVNYWVCHAVPASPTGVSVLRLNGTDMNVSWNQIPLLDARGFIVSYTVLYSKITTNKRRRQVMFVTVPGSETSALIGDLSPSHSYQVFVSAATSAGSGEYSSNPVVARSKFGTVLSCNIASHYITIFSYVLDILYKLYSMCECVFFMY